MNIHSYALPSETSSRFKAGSIGEKNQQKVLEAAVKVFSRKGFSGARIDEIAKEAGMSKTNMLYYFKTKKELYQVVIVRVLRRWLGTLGNLQSSDQPIDVITKYISKKMQMSQQYPEASRLIAMEIMAGAPVIGEFFQTELHAWVKEKGQVFLKWQNEGLMAPIEPAHVFFMIWALTQTYADFESQIAAVIKPNDYDSEIYPPATRFAIEVLVRGFDLKPRL
ncbi:MAG: TetR/AcrR family transcriptional regulator [Candidatus Paceibacteria bacterium]|jgi:TetR/AcrR family transcriptional regulator|tara:strand:+ start:2076 stop:2741 length:666 start_codon:yes stop_codon:yes gene_type:complete